MYMIRVPAGVEREAAARIREHLTDEFAETEPDTFRFDANGQPIDTLWRPVAAAVLAGVASFVLGQQFSSQDVERRPAHDALPYAVDAIGRPLVTAPAAGMPRFRLSFDRRREAWFLDADNNDDGHFDRRAQFHASGAAW
jgi:hypothetical protein